MVKGVEAFVYDLLVNVFNAKDTAPLAIDAIIKAGSYNLGPKAGRIENLRNGQRKDQKTCSRYLLGQRP
jgi:hypothetical protein